MDRYIGVLCLNEANLQVGDLAVLWGGSEQKVDDITHLDFSLFAPVCLLSTSTFSNSSDMVLFINLALNVGTADAATAARNALSTQASLNTCHLGFQYNGTANRTLPPTNLATPLKFCVWINGNTVLYYMQVIW